MRKDLFKKTPEVKARQSEYRRLAKEEARLRDIRAQVPDGLFRKCEACGEISDTEDIISGYHICPACGHYFRIPPHVRLSMILDRDSFTEWDTGLAQSDPLRFPGYPAKVAARRAATGLDEAVITGCGTIQDERTAVGVMASEFLMGSMGEIVGEKITRMVERATKERLPVILFCCSGGARMQEGMISLMQMAKTAQAIKRHSEAGLLYVSVLTDPTTGGVTASFAMLGDVILAESGALIGFAGPRVIEQTIGQKLPEGFQSAEFLEEHGFVDRIVKRSRLRQTLLFLLKSAKSGQDPDWAALDAELVRPIRADEAVPEITEERNANEPNGKIPASESGMELTRESGSNPPDSAAPASGIDSSAGTCAEDGTVSDNGKQDAPEAGQEEPAAWERVQIARSLDRPTSLHYIRSLFDRFLELHGDRAYADDGAIVGGIAELSGRYVTVIAQQKGRGIKENKKRNYGMPKPEGYRKALRLMKQADKFGRPVICFVDTPGAYCGIDAEERGQGEAIASCLYEMSGLRVPVLTVVIGEGGSGGALAMAVSNEVYLLENATYSILSPEGFASILWKDKKKAREAAGLMKITAKELLELGIIDGIIPESGEDSEGAGENVLRGVTTDTMEGTAMRIKERMLSFLARYGAMDGDTICELRYERFRKY